MSKKENIGVYGMKTWKQGTFSPRTFGPLAFAAVAVIVVFGFVITGCNTEGNEGPKKIAVTGVELSGSELDSDGNLGLKMVNGIGQTAQLTATLKPKNATDKTVTWKSDKPYIATVTVDKATGVATVKAVAVGKATITVTTANGKTAECAVTVGTESVTGVSFVEPTVTVEIDQAKPLAITVLPANAANKSVTWLSGDPTKATVVNGVVTGKALTTTPVTITVKTNDGGFEATCTVTVVAKTVHSVTLSPSTLDLAVNGTVKLTATVQPAGALNKTVTWSIEHGILGAAATLNNGVITAPTTPFVDSNPTNPVGDDWAYSTVTVTTEDGNFKATCRIEADNGMLDLMAPITAATFQMGSPTTETGHFPDPDDTAWTDETQHYVKLSKSFHMGRFQILLAQYANLIGYIPNYFYSDQRSYWGNNVGSCPADSVGWYEAVEYCNTLSEWEGFTPAYTIENRVPAATVAIASRYPITSATVTCNWDANGYRLPTEAEWEYGCRAGTTTPFNTGINIKPPTEEEWGDANYDGEYEELYNNGAGIPADWGEAIWEGMPMIPFLYSRNTWNLYSMHGNLEEWCWDWYGDYGTGTEANPDVDPKGLATGTYRVTRGGSFWDAAVDIRSASRNAYSPTSRNPSSHVGNAFIGFRIVRNMPPAGPGAKMVSGPGRTMPPEGRALPKGGLQQLMPQFTPQGIPQGMQKVKPQGLLQAIRKDDNFAPSRMTPQALRRKAFFE
jgi:uncharacterized protein YjdB